MLPYAQDTRQRIFPILDFNKLFEKTENTVLLNKFDFSTPGYSEKLSSSVFSRSTDIDFIARCQCEYLTGNYYMNMDKRAKPVVCPKCHTEVTCDMDAAEGHLVHRGWISCPDTVPGWLNPTVYKILSRYMRYGTRQKQPQTSNNDDVTNQGKPRKGNYIADILDIETDNPDEIAAAIQGKGFIYFYNNFDYIMNYFLYSHKWGTVKKGRDTLAYFLKENRHKLFCKYLPILSSSLHPFVMSEKSNENRRRFVDRNSRLVHAAASNLSYLEFSSHLSRRLDKIEKITYIAYMNIIAYTDDISIKQLSKKKSLPRQHIFGSRLNLTFRGVIVSITGPHSMDELHLPWTTAVNLLRLHIIGRLCQQGMSMSDAARLHASTMKQYNAQIDQMMKDFISESPYPGLPALFNRNPSIRAGSIQLLYITKIKTDVNDATIGFSCMAVPYPNADSI